MQYIYDNSNANVEFFFRVEKILASLVGISVQLGEVVRQGIIIIQIGIIIATSIYRVSLKKRSFRDWHPRCSKRPQDGP